MNAMGELLALASFYTTVGAAGFGFAALLLSGPVWGVEFAAFAWLLGCVAISLSLFLASLVCGPPWNATIIDAGAFFLAALGIWRFRKGRISFKKPAALDRWDWTLVAAIVIGTGWYFLKLSHESLGWDGVIVWEFKARLAFENGGRIPAAYYTDKARNLTHPDYPLFIPMLETWYYMAAGEIFQPALKWIFAPFYLVAIALAGIGAARLSQRRQAGLFAMAFFIFIPYPIEGLGNLGAGYADFPLSVFYLAAIVAFFLRPEPNLPLFAILAGSLFWIKRDGLIYYACAIAIACFMLRERSWRKWAARGIGAALPGAAIAIGWRLWLAMKHATADVDFGTVSVGAFLSNFSRTPQIIASMGLELANRDHWSLLWLGFAWVCLLRCRLRADRWLMVALLVLSPLAFDAGILFFDSAEYFEMHLSKALSRLVLQVAPLAWTFVAAGLAAEWRRASPEKTLEAGIAPPKEKTRASEQGIPQQP